MWDNANRLIATAQATSSVGSAYDNVDRRPSLTLPNGVTMTYSYDEEFRLTQLQYGTWGAGSSNLGNLNYAYDADGQRTVTGGSLAAVALPANVAAGTSTAHNADNEQNPFNGTSASYDANGNLTNGGHQ